MDTLKIRCLVIDDEHLAVEKLAGFVRKTPMLELAGTFTNPLEALGFLKTHAVDLIFLDIQMDDITGIQLLEILKEKPYIILTTAYSEFALKGYELNVTDYLLKPISFERFLQAVDKVSDKFWPQKPHPVAEAVHTPATPEREFILVKADYMMQKVCFSEILYIEGMKDYLGIVTTEKRIMTLMNFSTLENLLPEHGFCRVHKSFIIALSRIDQIERNHVIIRKQRIPIGDSYRKAFFELLKAKGIIQ
ncbi:MAG TPA: LytTR family DNA-binding domain-containing protein [Bacteroidales bacterium]|nr:LytTR family DNA-binding domain-containing protein [Bacteroidales bacterium]HRZ49761.1 LytTR family DNA-binding domain-containing protein [Bacteroidales bacterium]